MTLELKRFMNDADRELASGDWITAHHIWSNAEQEVVATITDGRQQLTESGDVWVTEENGVGSLHFGNEQEGYSHFPIRPGETILMYEKLKGTGIDAIHCVATDQIEPT